MVSIWRFSLDRLEKDWRYSLKDETLTCKLKLEVEISCQGNKVLRKFNYLGEQRIGLWSGTVYCKGRRGSWFIMMLEIAKNQALQTTKGSLDFTPTAAVVFILKSQL